MYSTKILLAAASLAVLASAGMASAAPWEHRHGAVWHRPYANNVRIVENLRFHNYRVIGTPYFVHGRYVVRSHDRFGHVVFVQVDPYSGAFVREVVL